VPASWIADALERPVYTVHAKAKRLGLRKSAAFYASSFAGRTDGRVGASARFPKGHVPANKGLRRPGWSVGRMAETQFKKGRPAHESANYVPIGTEKLDREGYLLRKVTDDPALFPARRWVAVHRLVWEAAHGPIPRGHMVAFLPGKRTAVRDAITPDILECISLAENMRRNTIHNLPAPLKEVVQIRGRLVRKIRKLEGRLPREKQS
jgi:hypothetical protein